MYRATEVWIMNARGVRWNINEREKCVSVYIVCTLPQARELELVITHARKRCKCYAKGWTITPSLDTSLVAIVE